MHNDAADSLLQVHDGEHACMHNIPMHTYKRSPKLTHVEARLSKLQNI